MTYRIFVSLPAGLEIISYPGISETSQEGHLAIPQLVEIDRLRILNPDAYGPTWLSWMRGKGNGEVAFRLEDVFFEAIDDYTGELIDIDTQILAWMKQ